MKFCKNALLFTMGGFSYMGLELLWRGWSHGSMFFAGGSCFLLLGKLNRPGLSPASKAVLGALTITGVELLTGLAVNQQHTVWDYTNQPFNFKGQICLGFSLLWLPISLVGSSLYSACDKLLQRTFRPEA